MIKRHTTKGLQLRDEGINFQAVYSLPEAINLLQE